MLRLYSRNTNNSFESRGVAVSAADTAEGRRPQLSPRDAPAARGVALGMGCSQRVRLAAKVETEGSATYVGCFSTELAPVAIIFHVFDTENSFIFALRQFYIFLKTKFFLKIVHERHDSDGSS